MPRYDYTCSANGHTLEVNHGMGEALSTWGELCERTGTELGSTPAGSPIIKELSTGTTVDVPRSTRSVPLPTTGCGCGRLPGCGSPIGGNH